MPEPTTPAERAAEALRLAEAATPGPWQEDGPWWWSEGTATSLITAGADRLAVAVMPATSTNGADLALIAAARSMLPALAADVQALTADLERSNAALEALVRADPDHLTAERAIAERDTAAAVVDRLLNGWTMLLDEEGIGEEPMWHHRGQCGKGHCCEEPTAGEVAYILHRREGQT